MKKLIIGILLPLFGCSTNIDSTPNIMFDTTKDAYLTDVRIEVVWVDKRNIHTRCVGLGASDGPAVLPFGGCAQIITSPTGTTCKLFVLKPASFNDSLAINILGHELYHCLGARHK